MEILFFLYGIILGIISGLLPGLHSNTIISIITALGFSNEQLALIIIALLPAHILISFIPSIFFGIPDQNTVVSVLPGQRMVLKGKGMLALKVVLISSLLAILISTFFFYFSLDFFELVYSLIREYVKYIVLVLSIIFLSRSKNIPFALVIFLLAGFLGYSSFNLKMTDPFLPLFSGMFAMAAFFTYSNNKLPKQKDVPVNNFGFIKYSLLGVLLGIFSDFLPGISSASQVAILLTLFMRLETLEYLAAISAITISQAMFTLATSVAIDKSRMGTTEMLAQVFDIKNNLLLLVVAFLVSAAIVSVIIYLLRKRVGQLANIDFSKFNLLLAAYLVCIVFIIDGTIGLVILVLASLLGYATIKLEVERTNLMGAVIIPTLMLLFRIFF